MIKLEHISKVFHPATVNENLAINDVSLTVNSGDFITIVGVTGQGRPPCST